MDQIWGHLLKMGWNATFKSRYCFFTRENALRGRGRSRGEVFLVAVVANVDHAAQFVRLLMPHPYRVFLLVNHKLWHRPINAILLQRGLFSGRQHRSAGKKQQIQKVGQFVLGDQRVCMAVASRAGNSTWKNEGSTIHSKQYKTTPCNKLIIKTERKRTSYSMNKYQYFNFWNDENCIDSQSNLKLNCIRHFVSTLHFLIIIFCYNSVTIHSHKSIEQIVRADGIIIISKSALPNWPTRWMKSFSLRRKMEIHHVVQVGNIHTTSGDIRHYHHLTPASTKISPGWSYAPAESREL